MECSDLIKRLNLMQFKLKNLGVLVRVFSSLWIILAIIRPVAGLRPLRERGRSWGDEVS